MDADSHAVYIVGSGAYTPVGLTAAASAAAVRAGISAFADHPFMINNDGEPYVLATLPTLSADLFGAQRYVALAVPAAAEALSTLNELPGKVRAMHVLIGLPERRPGLPENLTSMVRGAVAEVDDGHYAFTEVSAAQNGHAAGLMALAQGANLVRHREVEFCLAGGVDSYIDADTLDWIEDNEQLHKPDNAWGFVPGEAAGFCLVCSGYTARKYQLQPKARILSAARSTEPCAIKTKSICLGAGLTEAVSQTVAALPAQTLIDRFICDQNGEAYRADEVGFMMARLGERFAPESDMQTPADCWGDVGAASGPLFAALVSSAAERGYFTGNTVMLSASSEGGDRAAVLLQPVSRYVQ